MRPDEYKAKASRRYQARKKHQGNTTAAEIAERRRQNAAKARDTGTSIAAIRRRNGELPSIQQQCEESEAIAKERSRKYSRRKIVSNASRYEEMSLEGIPIGSMHANALLWLTVCVRRITTGC